MRHPLPTKAAKQGNWNRLVFFCSLQHIKPDCLRSSAETSGFRR